MGMRRWSAEGRGEAGRNIGGPRRIRVHPRRADHRKREPGDFKSRRFERPRPISCRSAV